VRRDGAAFGARERTILAAALPSLALALQAQDGTTPAPAAPAAADPALPHPVADGRRASLLAAQPPETLRGLTGRLIDPVVAWDARRGTDLVGTLRAFLDADGRWDLTAAHLGVHVNTVRNRLGRIEELTGTDVALLADRVDFVLALEAQDLLGAR
jgi:DNA-binding PucR family transcriptional regulator